MTDKLDLGYVTIPTEEFERLHSEIERLRILIVGLLHADEDAIEQARAEVNKL